jgi:hypothetical protein
MCSIVDQWVGVAFSLPPAAGHLLMLSVPWVRVHRAKRFLTGPTRPARNHGDGARTQHDVPVCPRVLACVHYQNGKILLVFLSNNKILSLVIAYENPH